MIDARSAIRRSFVQTGAAVGIALLLAACGGGGGGSQSAPPVNSQPPASTPPPPPPPPPPPVDALLRMWRYKPPGTLSLDYENITCTGERPAGIIDRYHDCTLPYTDVLTTVAFDVRVDPGSLQDYEIVAESVRSATLTLVLGPAYGSKTITVPVINMAGFMIEKSTYWCAENTKCDQWWWSPSGGSISGSNVFRKVSSWIDEPTGDSISVGLDWGLSVDAPYETTIVVTLTREHSSDRTWWYTKEATVVISGPLRKG
jgi:hypothetical protein